jgi:hypothetical protein
MCSRDRNQAGGVDQAVSGREPQERPQRTRFLLDSLGLVAGQRATNAPIVAASQEASPPRVPVKATNSPATVPYVRTVDTA